MLDNFQIKVLMLAHELEKTMARMYEVFAERFPDHEPMWQHLIEEETGHAEAIRKLYQLTYEKKSSFNAGTIKLDAIQSVIDHITSITESAKRGRYSEAQILTIAHDMEKSLFEKDFFTHFRVTDEYSDILTQLRNEDMCHIQLTREELDKFLASTT